MKKTITVECYRLAIPILCSVFVIFTVLSFTFRTISTQLLTIIGSISAASLFIVLTIATCLSIEHSCAIIFCPCCVWQSAIPDTFPNVKSRTQIESAQLEQTPSIFAPERTSVDEPRLQLPPLYSPKSTASSTRERRNISLRNELRK